MKWQRVVNLAHLILHQFNTIYGYPWTWMVDFGRWSSIVGRSWLRRKFLRTVDHFFFAGWRFQALRRAHSHPNLKSIWLSRDALRTLWCSSFPFPQLFFSNRVPGWTHPSCARTGPASCLWRSAWPGGMAWIAAIAAIAAIETVEIPPNTPSVSGGKNE